jgi:hypothetical protein
VHRTFVLATCLAATALGCAGRPDPVETRDAVARWTLSKGGRLVVSGKPGEIHALQQLPHGAFDIEKIVLNETRVGDAELGQLRGLNHLASLSLYRTDVGDPGMEQIADIKSLTELELSYTRITDDGLRKLTGLKNLRKLFIRGTNQSVTNGGVKDLSAAIPACEIYR